MWNDIKFSPSGDQVTKEDLLQFQTNLNRTMRHKMENIRVRQLVETLEVGSNVIMGENASISWTNVTDQPTIPTQYTDSDALIAINSTYIDADGVWTPQVYAENINTNNAKISSAQIDSITANQLVIGGENGSISFEDLSDKPAVYTWLGTFSDFPPSPTTQDAFYHTVNKKSYIYNGSSWEVFAESGSDGVDGQDGVDGADGAEGPQGPTGPQGPAGEDGDYFAPSWVQETFIDFTGIETPTIEANNAVINGDLRVGATNGVVGISGADANNANAIRFWAGNHNKNNAPFKVTQGGSVTMTDATIISGTAGGQRLEIDTDGISTYISGSTRNGIEIRYTAGDVGIRFHYDGNIAGTIFPHSSGNLVITGDVVFDQSTSGGNRLGYKKINVGPDAPTDTSGDTIWVDTN